jgi:2-C-methyl-D-erythritol 4-phosphate cytidylyltransferase
MSRAAIIAAAGIGRRMGGDRPKQYLELCGRPIICHTLDRFLDYGTLDFVVVVVEPGREDYFRQHILNAFGYPGEWQVTGGGQLRQQSVANGLRLVPKDCDVVVVHDGVRPFITAKDIERTADLAAREGAAVLAAKVRETVKRVGENGQVMETVDRERLWSVQTPQAFKRDLLAQAMESAISDGFVGTDEASIVERIGGKVWVIEGDARNIKITTPEELAIAEAILKGRDW